MLFLGDIACPEQKIENFIDCVNRMSLFNDEIIVANLEAVIVDENIQRKKNTLYNLSKIIHVFSNSKKVIFSLANNHMYDYPEKILDTKAFLNRNNIATFGLYEGKKIKPYEYVDEEKKYAFFGHCWRLYTNTNQNKKNDVRVVDCSYDYFVNVIKKYKETHSDVTVYCFMHWNYDLEKYPFPLHRKLSKVLIDSGADAVIGNHSHRPQGYEIYRGSIIAYGLGNFYLPSGIYFNKNLVFPKYAHKTYGIRINNNIIDRVWFYTDSINMPIKFIKTDKNISSNHNYSDYIEMNEKSYQIFFRKNRRKKFLVPVFTEIEGKKLYIQEEWAIIRVKILRKIKGLLGR